MSSSIKEGFLWKKSPASLRAWQKRWCVLSLEGLAYFKAKNDDTNQGIVPISEIVRVEYYPNHPNFVNITIRSGRVFYWKAANPGEAQEWCMAVNATRNKKEQKQIAEAKAEHSEPKFTVQIIGARNIAAADRNGFSDPYCWLEVDHAEEVVWRTKTHTIHKTLTPTWNASFDLKANAQIGKMNDLEWEDMAIAVEVWDANQVESDTFLGEVEIPISSLEDGGNIDGNGNGEWYPLVAKSERRQKISQAKALQRAVKTVTGQILVAIKHQPSAYLAKMPYYQFGRSLQQLSLYSTKLPYYRAPIPTVLLKMKDTLVALGGMESEGIFRLAPNGTESKKIKKWINQAWVQKGIQTGFETLCRDCNEMAHLIKSFCRELPSGLCDSLEVREMDACHSPEQANTLLSRMPEPAQSVVRWLIDLAVEVAARESVNRMGVKNLALVIGVNIRKGAPDDVMEYKEFLNSVTTFFKLATDFRQSERNSATDDGKSSSGASQAEASNAATGKGMDDDDEVEEDDTHLPAPGEGVEADGSGFSVPTPHGQSKRLSDLVSSPTSASPSPLSPLAVSSPTANPSKPGKKLHRHFREEDAHEAPPTKVMPVHTITGSYGERLAKDRDFQSKLNAPLTAAELPPKPVTPQPVETEETVVPVSEITEEVPIPDAEDGDAPPPPEEEYLEAPAEEVVDEAAAAEAVEAEDLPVEEEVPLAGDEDAPPPSEEAELAEAEAQVEQAEPELEPEPAVEALEESAAVSEPVMPVVEIPVEEPAQLAPVPSPSHKAPSEAKASPATSPARARPQAPQAAGSITTAAVPPPSKLVHQFNAINAAHAAAAAVSNQASSVNKLAAKPAVAPAPTPTVAATSTAATPAAKPASKPAAKAAAKPAAKATVAKPAGATASAKPAAKPGSSTAAAAASPSVKPAAKATAKPAAKAAAKPAAKVAAKAGTAKPLAATSTPAGKAAAAKPAAKAAATTTAGSASVKAAASPPAAGSNSVKSPASPKVAASASPTSPKLAPLASPVPESKESKAAPSATVAAANARRAVSPSHASGKAASFSVAANPALAAIAKENKATAPATSAAPASAASPSRALSPGRVASASVAVSPSPRAAMGPTPTNASASALSPSRQRPVAKPRSQLESLEATLNQLDSL